ncbi:MAG: hypothetical protein HYY76_00665, partial [Acidobacteria bacterium]|nr:hypothetical protein [Acidobacteriota bacterium]
MFLKYLSSTDHKVIGLLYGFTSLFFLLVGFVLVLLMRWQLAYPGEPVPYVGGLLGEAAAPGGIVLPEFYNQLGAPGWAVNDRGDDARSASAEDETTTEADRPHEGSYVASGFS